MTKFLIKSLTALVFGILFFSSLIFLPKIYFSIILAIIGLICIFEFIRLFPFNKLWLFLILPIYPIFSFLLMIYMNQLGQKLELFLLFISVFAFDTGAYLVGINFGKHKISKISPNKSWEGFFGGLVIMFLIVSLVLYVGEHFNFISALLFSALIAIVAQIGDLFESWFKRRARIKDSGILLPGHGGFLDRFDAVIFVAPFFLLILRVVQ